MKLKNYGPFTLFLCLIIIVFILFAPHYFSKPNLDKLIDKIFVREIKWKGIITIWDYPRLDITTGYNYSWLRNKIKEFENQNPGVFIEFKPLTPEHGHIEIETSVKTNTQPDIAPVGTNLRLISKGNLEPLDGYLKEEEIDDYRLQALSSVKYGEHIWGIPYMMEPYALFLNLDLFKERNVTAPKDGNWSYDEFLECLKKLTYDKNKNKKLHSYGFNSFISPNSYNTWGILFSDGGEIINHKTREYTFYGEEAISGLKKLVDLRLLHRVTPENFGTNSKEEAWRSFAIDKKVAVYPAKSSTVNRLKSLSNNGKGFDFTVANYPIGELKIPISACDIVTAYGVFKQEDKEKLDMCIKFIKHLTNDDSQKELYKQGVFPVKKSIGNIYKNDKTMLAIEKSISYSKPMGMHENWMKIDDILQSQIRMALLGKKTPEEAIKDAKDMIESMD